MRAVVLEKPGGSLGIRDVPVPKPAPGQALLRVRACGVCRTDLHIVDGELPRPKLPLIPGHEIVAEVVELGPDQDDAATEERPPLRPGDRVGVPWLGWTCGECVYCRRGQENLCDNARFTGYTIDGGFAEYTVADTRYVFRLDGKASRFDDASAAPLLCAGLIGYRTYRLALDAIGYPAKRIGLYGFGAAAHLLCQLAVADGMEVFAFTREGDEAGQRFAERLGAVWAGASTERPPAKLDAALIFAPVGSLVVEALASVDKGGVVVSGGIHMSDVPSFPYRMLWEERSISSVANLERRDGVEFLKRAAEVPVETSTRVYALEDAASALNDLRDGKLEGAALLVP